MENYGFIRVAAAMPVVRVADPAANAENICAMIGEAAAEGVSLLAFPELSVTGYTCGDLFGQQRLVEGAEEAVRRIMEYTRGKSITVVAGAPVRYCDRLYNCAVVIRNGNIKGIVPKTHLPSYNEYYESRWFSSGSDFLQGPSSVSGRFLVNGKDTVREGFNAEVRYAGFMCNISPNMLFSIGKAVFAVEICEDLWTPVPPSSYHCLCGAQVILNLSASNEVLMKHAYRKELVRQQSARTVSAYVYCSAGFGESTQDVVYAGSSMICENGSLLAENRRFCTGASMIISDVDIEKLSVQRQKMSTFSSVAPDGTPSSSYSGLYSRVDAGVPARTDFNRMLYRHVEPHPFVPSDDDRGERCREIIAIQVTGLASRLLHIGCRHAVVGISGGLDSTLALLVTVKAFDKAGLDRKGITGVTMPGYGTTGRTYGNALALMRGLGVTVREIPVADACDLHFRDIGHDKSVHDVTYENTQARERTQILMDLANQCGGIVIGTGDLSELALGWATYNGDHMSMYGVNASIPKTLVRHLVRWMADTLDEVRPVLMDIIDTPVSPELLPADESGNISQKTEDLVGPYELHDFFLYNFFRFGYSPEKLLFLAGKAFCKGECGQGANGEPGGGYSPETVEKWLRVFLRRFFSQQFKRSCLPDGPKVGSVALSPRGDWRMPSDVSSAFFISGLDRAGKRSQD